MTKRSRWRPTVLAAKTLIYPADLLAAVAAAFPRAPMRADEAALDAAAAQLDAAARTVLTRLASARTTDLDLIEFDLDTIRRLTEAILVTLEVKREVVDEVALVQRAKATAPPTLLVTTLEGAAHAAGFHPPNQALDEALTHVANLYQWADAAKVTFRAGRNAPRQRQLNAFSLTRAFGESVATAEDIGNAETAAAGNRFQLSATHVHAGADLGLAVIGAYNILTSRPIAISRTSANKQSIGGAVIGPLPRFVLEVFARVRQKLASEATLCRFSMAPAFRPTGATVARWVQAYKKEASKT